MTPLRSVADTELSRVLAVALTIGADGLLQDRLRGLSGIAAGQDFAVEQPGGWAWIRIEGGEGRATRVRPLDIPVVDQQMLRDRAAMVGPALLASLSRSGTGLAAARMVAALLGPAEAPDRDAFSVLVPWMPVIEPIAYKTAASIAVSLDLMRPHLLPVLAGPSAATMGLLDEYWRRLHGMAQFSLLASDGAAAPWLGEMADQFAWSNWTPSFTLLRERTTWLAACAARSAAAFGERVVPKYLAVIERAGHPFKTFDALFGLAAIARAFPRSAAGIAAEIRRLSAGIEGADKATRASLQLSFDDALAVIEDRAPWARANAPDLVDIGWRPSSPRGLATAAALRADPASPTASGHFRGFAILPESIARPLALFNPDRRRGRGERRETPLQTVAAVLNATWGGTSPAPPTVH